MASTQTTNRGWPKGAIKNPKTGAMLRNKRGEPILRGTRAASLAGFGPNATKGKTRTTGTRSQSNRTQSRAGTGTRTQSKRNTTMRSSRSA